MVELGLAVLLAFVALPFAVWGDARRVRARAGSLLDEATAAAWQRAMIVGAVVLVHGALFATGHSFDSIAGYRSRSSMESVYGWLAGAVALVGAGLALRLAARDVKLAARFRRARAVILSQAAPAEPGGVDFGVGAAHFEARVTRGVGTYRHGEVVVWSASGDPVAPWHVRIAPWIDVATALGAAALGVLDLGV